MKSDEIKNDAAAVTAFIKKLDKPFGKAIEALRKIILSADKNIGEEIKWSHPTFFYSGKMKPSNPKEYKRYIIVTNFQKGRILLVFPNGAKIDDGSGFLEGEYKDGRRLLYFTDWKDIKLKEKKLKKLIRDWIKLIDT